MMKWCWCVLMLLLMGASVGGAQQKAVDPVFVRAQELVSDGNGVAGRALIDSVLKANSPTSRIYPQALFWRASLAASAADAESDYKHLVVDYPLAPEAEQALLRLAQLELARGDKEGALAHLQRIPRDYPHSRSLARASYWTARVLFEKNDIPGACSANASALAQITADEIELQNQIQYQGQRCVAFNASRAAAATPASPAASASVVDAAASPHTRDSTTASSTIASLPAPANPPVDTLATTAKVPAPKASPVRPPTPDPVVNSSGFSVQVAAYSKKAEAQRLVASLVKRGYDARVDGQAAPFRVRIGRYPSAREAEAALSRIKAKGMAGFVVRAPAK